MPSPIGHSITGIIFLVLWRRLRHWRELLQYWREGILFILLADLPDIDLFNPSEKMFDLYSPHHHGEIHTFAFAFFVALVVTGLNSYRIKKWNWKLWGWAFAAISSHIVLDLFFSNSTTPPGMPIFWPFLKERIILPIHWYYYWEKSDIFSSTNFINGVGEGVVGTTLIALILWRNSKKRKR